MNILSIQESGKIKASDAALLSINNLSIEQATQIMVQLVLSTGDSVRAQFVGNLPGQTGEPIDIKYKDWLMTLEDASSFLDEKRKTALDDLPDNFKKEMSNILLDIENINSSLNVLKK